MLALAVGLGVSGGVTLAMASPYQDHDPDYSKNKTYQQGLKDGQADKKHKLDHSKKRHYPKDEDSKAYEAGYQKGRN